MKNGYQDGRDAILAEYKNGSPSDPPPVLLATTEGRDDTPTDHPWQHYRPSWAVDTPLRSGDADEPMEGSGVSEGSPPAVPATG